MTISELTLKESLFILALGKYGTTGGSFIGFGLAGAGILELVQSGKADEQGKMLILKSSKHSGDAILDYYIDTIRKSTKTRPIKHWVSRIGHRPGKIKKLLIPVLLKKKAIRKQKKRFLFFTYYRYPANDNLRNDLVKTMKNYLQGRKDEKSEMLFLLCGAIKIFNKVFDAKEDRRKANTLFKELKKKDFVISGISDTVQAVQAAVLVTTVAAASTASSGAH